MNLRLLFTLLFDPLISTTLKFIFSNDVECSEDRESGMRKLPVIDLQFLNASAPTELKPSFNINPVKPLESWNAFFSIAVIVDGISNIELNPIQ